MANINKEKDGLSISRGKKKEKQRNRMAFVSLSH